MKALFGTAGKGEAFTRLKLKKIIDIPKYLLEYKLDAFEYQCGRGVKISEKSAKEFGESCSKSNIKLSLHAPYYISLSSSEEIKRNNSIKYIEDSAIAAYNMGADRIIVHSGSCGKMTREKALELAKDTISKAIIHMKDIGLYDKVHICPETMGKINQLGNVEEVISLCSIDESLIPCIDFGHINCRTNGGLKKKEDFEKILDSMKNSLGEYRSSNFHSHFSKIEYTEKGGEVKHITFEDKVFGPDFEPLAELVAKRNLTPVFICESAGTQDIDAEYMRNRYESYLK